MRASDDFWPRDPASHTIHIASVAYNTVFLGEFMQPDWDMFHVSINTFLLLCLQYDFFYGLAANVFCFHAIRVFTLWLNTTLQPEQLAVVPYTSGK